MSDKVLSGGKKLEEALAKIAAGLKAELKVGFLAGATYPDGTPVPAVAFWNEFGNGKSPPRPFFRRMIAKESGEWPEAIARGLKATNYDGKKVLGVMGEVIKGQLQQSITDLTDPPLAHSTIARKGFAKPLIDSGHMKDSVDYEVN